MLLSCYFLFFFYVSYLIFVERVSIKNVQQHLPKHKMLKKKHYKNAPQINNKKSNCCMDLCTVNLGLKRKQIIKLGLCMDLGFVSSNFLRNVNFRSKLVVFVWKPSPIDWPNLECLYCCMMHEWRQLRPISLSRMWLSAFSRTSISPGCIDVMLKSIAS